MRTTLKSLSDILLSSQSSWKEKYDVLKKMHTLFVSKGALSAFIEHTNDTDEDDTWLEKGCAISPKSAGMCLFEVKRTQLFVEGLITAIKDMMAASNKRPVQVLDAGAGPYAIFPLLAALYFSPEEVQFTAIDIHPENIESIQLLLNAFELQAYFASISLDNAITYQWPGEGKPDIIVTETMKNGLNKETQMPITLNLNKQLSPNGIFIPEQIKLSLKQVHLNKQKNAIFQTYENIQPQLEKKVEMELNYANFEKDLGTILTLNKNTSAAEMKRNPLCTISVPDSFIPESHSLSIYTDIQVYKELLLSRNDTSISFSITISKPTKPILRANQEIDFSYDNGVNPGIRFAVRNQVNPLLRNA